MRTLQECAVELKERGVQDVKFTFAPDVKQMGADQVRADAAEILSDYLDGNYTVLPYIGDRKTS